MQLQQLNAWQGRALDNAQQGRMDGNVRLDVSNLWQHELLARHEINESQEWHPESVFQSTQAA